MSETTRLDFSDFSEPAHRPGRKRSFASAMRWTLSITEQMKYRFVPSRTVSYAPQSHPCTGQKMQTLRFPKADENSVAWQPVRIRLRNVQWDTSPVAARGGSLFCVWTPSIETYVSEGKPLHTLLVPLWNQPDHADSTFRCFQQGGQYRQA